MQTIEVVVTRGGVTGEPVVVIEGLGYTILDALRDCLTTDAAKGIRRGDYLLVRTPQWMEFLPIATRRGKGES